ncbi:MAG: hypothetical protein AAF682_12255, partial [Planctomycetota bacterium]
PEAPVTAAREPRVAAVAQPVAVRPPAESAAEPIEERRTVATTHAAPTAAAAASPQEEPLELDFSVESYLEGTVRGAGLRELWVGAHAAQYGGPDVWFPAEPATTACGQGGEFRLTIPAGVTSVLLVAAAAERAPATRLVRLRSGSTKRIELDLEDPGAPVAGMVVSGPWNAPLAGAQVNLWYDDGHAPWTLGPYLLTYVEGAYRLGGAQLTCDGQGRFRVGGLMRRPYRARAAPPKDDWAGLTIELGAADPGEPVHPPDAGLVLSPNVRELQLEVFGPEDELPSGARVTWGPLKLLEQEAQREGAAAEWSPGAAAGSRGRAVPKLPTQGLPEDGRLRLLFDPETADGVCFSSPGYAPVLVDPRPLHGVAEVELVKAYELPTLELNVLFSGAQAPDTVRVTLTPDDERLPKTEQLRRRFGGPMLFRELPPGPYTIEVRPKGKSPFVAATARVQLAVGPPNAAEVLLRHGAELRVVPVAALDDDSGLVARVRLQDGRTLVLAPVRGDDLGEDGDDAEAPAAPGEGGTPAEASAAAPARPARPAGEPIRFEPRVPEGTWPVEIAREDGLLWSGELRFFAGVVAELRSQLPHPSVR